MINNEDVLFFLRSSFNFLKTFNLFFQSSAERTLLNTYEYDFTRQVDLDTNIRIFFEILLFETGYFENF